MNNMFTPPSRLKYIKSINCIKIYATPNGKYITKSIDSWKIHNKISQASDYCHKNTSDASRYSGNTGSFVITISKSDAINVLEYIRHRGDMKLLADRLEKIARSK